MTAPAIRSDMTWFVVEMYAGTMST